MGDDERTEELRERQLERERAERRRSADAEAEEDTRTHRRRAEKAHYLRAKLEERAEAEDEA